MSLRRIILLIGLLFSLMSQATIDSYPFNSPEQEREYRQLTEQLRCPKCQNNNIADSNAVIATDMRLKVYELVNQGYSKQQVIDYMVQRYGHFVTYDPPITSATLILWLAPLLSLLVGGTVIVRYGRRKAVHDNGIDRPIRQHRPVKEAIISVGRRSMLLPGVLFALLIALGLYVMTGGWQQWLSWRQVQTQLPVLRERLQNEQSQPLSEAELVRLGQALRSNLQREPNNLQDWLLLGRTGLLRGDASLAFQAFGRAYQLAPEQAEVQLEYAGMLARSVEPMDQQLAIEILRDLLRRDQANLQALSLLALIAFEQGNFQQAIGAWGSMLKLLPPADSRRGVVIRSIEQAKIQASAGE